ncbi:hypothetical protein ACFL9U_05220 [Thermodesulfobacteriota bacterium]
MQDNLNLKNEGKDGAIVAVLTLPKLAKKSLHAGSMNKEINKLKEKILDLEKR